MFSCVWLHFKKCFGKYFLMFVCVLENTIENTFSHIFLVTKWIYNIIHSSKYKQNPGKNHQIRTNEGKIAINEIAIGAIAIGVIDTFAVSVMSAPRRLWCRWCRRTARCRWCRDLFFLSPSLSLSLSLCLSLSLSLSLLLSQAGSHLKWKWKRKWFFVVLALKFGQLEMLFSLTEFEVTTKHPIFRKIISRINLKLIQTQPKYVNSLWVLVCWRSQKSVLMLV